jgi:hypothetical protein
MQWPPNLEKKKKKRISDVLKTRDSWQANSSISAL